MNYKMYSVTQSAMAFFATAAFCVAGLQPQTVVVAIVIGLIFVVSYIKVQRYLLNFCSINDTLTTEYQIKFS